MEKKTIVVIGATGAQGTGVVRSLIADGTFSVRAVTRKPEAYTGEAQETVFGDLNDRASLESAFRNAYGVFAVTDFWEGGDEYAQGMNAVEAARSAGVAHFIWSTLPNVEVVSNGAFDVPHFSTKAKVDQLVTDAGFPYATFVQPPFYFQNLTGQLSPQSLQDGGTGWTLPIDPIKKVIHMSDIADLGKVVAGAFLQPEKAGHGNYLSLATELNSFQDIVDAYKQNGQSHTFTQVPADVFAGFFEGAAELAAMFGYFEKYTYMGPDASARIQLAKEVSTGEFNSLEKWLRENVS